MASPTSSSMSFFVSLQDLCKLKILFSMEEFPIESFKLLPDSIKHRLFKILPLIDRLHFDTTSKFRQEFNITDVPPPTEEERNSTAIPRTARVLYGNSNDMRETLLRCLFTTNPTYSIPYQMTERAFKEGCRLNLHEMARFVKCLSVWDDTYVDIAIKYMESCYPCTLITIPEHRRPYIEEGEVEDPLDKYILVPSRITKFMSVKLEYDLAITLTNTPAFINYCHILPKLSLPADKSFSIDTIQMHSSPLWKEYYEPLQERLPRIQRLPDGSIEKGEINPLVPFLQEVLAPIEHLSIGTDEEFEPTDDDEELSIDVPYFILHNLLSHPNPSLKSIHIHGISPTVVNTVQTVAAFLGGIKHNPLAGIMQDRYSRQGNEYSLVPPNKPYFIEELKITAESGDRDYVSQYMTEYDSTAISQVVDQIIEVQQSTLKSISLRELGFLYKSLDTSNERLESSSIRGSDVEKGNSEAYCSLLQSTFPDFVKLPQFESLSLGKSPDRKCYHIVMEFLKTPATHDQELEIVLKPKKTAILDWYKRYRVPQDLPVSNVEFKSLHLDGKKSQLLKFVLSFPSLSLKSFELSTHHLKAKDVLPTIANIKNFTLRVESDTAKDTKLDVFISKNPLLTNLKVSQVWSHQDFPSIFNTVNKSLLRLAEMGRKLESITIQNIEIQKFMHYNQWKYGRSRGQGLFVSSDEEGYDFSDPSGTTAAATAAASPDIITIPPSVTDKDLYSFFLLVEKLEATLTIDCQVVMHEAHRFNDNLFPSLKQANVKIRKITLKGEIKQCHELFRGIADTVEVSDEKKQHDF